MNFGKGEVLRLTNDYSIFINTAQVLLVAETVSAFFQSNFEHDLYRFLIGR